MKRLFLAMMMMTAAAACSSNSSTSTPAGTAPDVVATTDAAPGDAADSTGGNGDTTSDTGAKPDAGKDATKDVPAAPVLCSMADNTCLLKCGDTKCKAEQKACDDEPKCKAYSTCVGGCQQNPPVAPPADVTGATCQDKCVTLAGDATELAGNVGLCIFGNCVQCDPADKAYKTCNENCSQGMCVAELNACLGDKNCGDLVACIGEKCGTASAADVQACVQSKCAAFLSNDTITLLNDAATCINDAKEEPACKGQ